MSAKHHDLFSNPTFLFTAGGQEESLKEAQRLRELHPWARRTLFLLSEHEFALSYQENSPNSVGKILSFDHGRMTFRAAYILYERWNNHTRDPVPFRMVFANGKLFALLAPEDTPIPLDMTSLPDDVAEYIAHLWNSCPYRQATNPKDTLLSEPNSGKAP